VVLVNNKSGDYINASYVNLRLPTERTNRYIAAQGPTNKTVADFWRMVQQGKCKVIVMLTNLTENGRVKCHQYWPDTYSTSLKLDNDLELQCLREQFDETDRFVFRDLMLRDTTTGEESVVRHMHYMVWPDHGVPSDVQQCLEFLQIVRSASNEAENLPILVHCSAGVGRTGVLVMLDLALDLLEKNLPINPLELLKKVRNLRPKMIQTPVSQNIENLIKFSLTFLYFFFSQIGTVSISLRRNFGNVFAIVRKCLKLYGVMHVKTVFSVILC
jgi:protein tyrosine phosphatase